MYRIVLVSVVVWIVKNVKSAEDFPSLISANVSLGMKNYDMLFDRI